MHFSTFIAQTSLYDRDDFTEPKNIFPPTFYKIIPVWTAILDISQYISQAGYCNIYYKQNQRVNQIPASTCCNT